ncbi:MAG TPA: NTF2 fold immunity protein, partial [Terriglobales bacterium]|nr:NTF2 fold immunity protein [Terriglobales bacterium]
SAYYDVRPFAFMRFWIISSFVLLAVCVGATAQYKPKDGFVPDAATAIKVAVAIWGPIFGEAKIANEKPYHAVLKEGTWIVEGSVPEGYLGGVAERKSRKRTEELYPCHMANDRSNHAMERTTDRYAPHF